MSQQVRGRLVRLGWLAACCLAGLGVLLAMAALWWPRAAYWLNTGQAGEAAEFAFVLGGAPGSRSVAAADLYARGLARVILVSHEHVLYPQTRLVPPGHELCRRVLRAEGVPEEALVVIGRDARNTEDEARALEAFLAGRPRTRVAVVTNAFHTRRAAMAFRRSLGDSQHDVFWVSAPNPGFDEKGWWRSETGLTTVLSEYVKITIVLLRAIWVVLLLAGLGAGLGLAALICRRNRMFWGSTVRTRPT